MGGFVSTLLDIGAAIPSPAQPFLAGAAAINGAIQGANAQKADASAASGYNQQEQNMVKQLTGTSWLQPVLDAEAGGVNTLKSQVGGTANIGQLAKTLMGDNLKTAISAGLGQRGSNLQAGIGDISSLSDKAVTAGQSMGNPYSQLAPGLSGLKPLFGGGSGGGGGNVGGSGLGPAGDGGDAGLNSLSSGF